MIQISLRVSIKDLQDGLILIVSFKIFFPKIELDFYKNLYKKDIEGQYMKPYKTFFVPFYSTKLDLNNINNPVKNRASSSDKGEEIKG